MIRRAAKRLLKVERQVTPSVALKVGGMPVPPPTSKHYIIRGGVLVEVSKRPAGETR